MYLSTMDEAQASGHAAFLAGNFTDAVKHYTEAIALSPSNHLLYCDRSAAYASLDDFPSALSDAQRAVQLNSSWPACHIRLGVAYLGLRNYSKSISAYQDGLRIAPTNEALKAGLAKATADRSLAGPFAGGPYSGLQQQQMFLQNPFNMQQPLQNRVYNSQPSHVQHMQQMQVQPQYRQMQQQFNMPGQQLTKNVINGDGKATQCGPSSSTDTQIVGSSKTTFSAGLAADASLSNGVRSLRSPSAPSVAEMVASKKQKMAADAFDLPGDLAKLIENPSNIWANVQPLWTPQAKERHANMASLDIANEAVAMQWQGLQASLGAHEALKRAQEDLEKAEVQSKKEKEANDTLAQKNLELEESMSMLQTRIKELENDISKMSEDHGQLNLELKEAASYFGWKARIEMMEEFEAGKHVAWNPSEEKALFLEAYPPAQAKQKDAPVKEVGPPAQDIDKETVEFEVAEETFEVV